MQVWKLKQSHELRTNTNGQANWIEASGSEQGTQTCSLL
jgi:hypothetical protein